MRCIITLVTFISINTSIAQNKSDTIDYKKHEINTPSISTPSANKLNKNRQLLTAPDQIGFGKLTIDSDVPPTTSIREQIIDSAYRSVKLYMALTEKEFRAWENANYKKTLTCNINLNLGNPPITPISGISFTSITNLFVKKKSTVPPLSAEERLKIHEEWKEKLRTQRDIMPQTENNKETIENNTPFPTFTIPLHDMINDFIYITN